MLNISGLNNGVVIDHIQPGGAFEIYNYLKLDKLDCTVAIIKNARSNKFEGKKDMIKIEGPLCVDLDILGALSPNLTVNIIKDGEITEKRHLNLPETVTSILRCRNPRCITSIEQELTHKFKLADKNTGIYRCIYCEQKYSNRS